MKKAKKLNKAEKLNAQVMSVLKKRGGYKTNKWFKMAEDDTTFVSEFTNEGGVCLFYLWLAAFVKVTKPKIMVEMGASKGGSAIAILSELPKDGKLYSVELKDGEDMWYYVPEWEERIITLVGDDIVPETYPDDFPWEDVDVWFIDSNHALEHVQAQNKMILLKAKKGAIIINHDVYYKGLAGYLRTIPLDWWEDNKKVFNHGLGLHICE